MRWRSMVTAASGAVLWQPASIPAEVLLKFFSRWHGPSVLHHAAAGTVATLGIVQARSTLCAVSSVSAAVCALHLVSYVLISVSLVQA